VGSLNEESDEWVLQVSQLDGRQTSNSRIGICLHDWCVRVLGMVRSSEATVEHVQDDCGEGRWRRKLITDRAGSVTSAPAH